MWRLFFDTSTRKRVLHWLRSGRFWRNGPPDVPPDPESHVRFPKPPGPTGRNASAAAREPDEERAVMRVRGLTLDEVIRRSSQEPRERSAAIFRCHEE